MDDSMLAIYDEQLRTDAEVPGADSVTRLGSLRLATYGGGRGFVTYRELGGDPRTLVRDALAHFVGDPEIRKVEWKTRGHDHTPGLREALLDNGFEPLETESIMMGETEKLAVDVRPPDGVTLRRVTEPDDVRAVSAMQDEAFGDDFRVEAADALVRRLALDDGMELWAAEADGRIVAAGRLEPVAGSDVAGIWGGSTLKEWRGRGIYRALVATRAHSALRLGRRLLHSDSTEYSRPILERSGMVKVSTTTPYLWRR